MNEKQEEWVLLQRAQDKDEEALELVLERYKPLMKSLANKYFIRGADRDDIIQEASIALYRSILTFDLNSEVPFSAYAKQNATRAVIDAIRRAETHKNAMLSNSLPLVEGFEIEYFTTEAEWESGEANEEMHTLLEKKLSKLEREVMYKRLLGLSYREISSHLEISEKAVDNALQRIKRKLFT